jgi:hypothetical protein
MRGATHLSLPVRGFSRRHVELKTTTRVLRLSNNRRRTATDAGCAGSSEVTTPTMYSYYLLSRLPRIVGRLVVPRQQHRRINYS